MGIFDDVRAGRWAGWTGLPAGLSLRDAAAELGALIDVHRRGATTVHQLTGEVRLWVPDDVVELVELDHPLGDASAVDDLGPPDVEQPARFGVFGSATTEHVWIERGLVLVTAVEYDHDLGGPPVDTSPRLVHAELFVPTELARWREGPGRWSWQRRPQPH
ncbi:MAG: hypothetical protein ACRDZZ_13555 [Ilumatobacteraceae bacterium]